MNRNMRGLSGLGYVETEWTGICGDRGDRDVWRMSGLWRVEAE